MEYSKRKIDTEVKSRGGADFTYEDPNGLIAENQLKGKQTVSADGMIIPWHAVDIGIVTSAIVTAEKGNPRYCEAGGGGSDSVCEAKVCTAKVSC